jgi:putative membrane protein
MRKQFRLFAFAATVAVMTAMPAAQQPGAGTPQPARPGGQGRTTTSSSTSSAEKSTLASSDEKFVKEAAQGGQAEVELGRLATTKASSPDVKQFGQRMVDDHSKANMQLMDIVRRKNLSVATELSGKHKSEYDRLSKLSGTEFDRAYVKLMVDDHKKDVSDFEKQASSAKDPDIRSFASQTLPTLQQHLAMIQQIHGRETSGTSGHDSSSNRARGTSGSSGGATTGSTGGSTTGSGTNSTGGR